MNIGILYDFIIKNNGRCNFNDKEFLEELSYTLKLAFSLNEYFTGIYINDLRCKNATAVYKYKSGNVQLDINEINDYLDKYFDYFNISDMTQYKEYYIYSVILHEIVHACQYMFLNSNIFNINRTLLIDSLNVIRGNFNLNNKRLLNIINSSKGYSLYNNYHSYFPIEREANVISDNITKSIYSEISSKYVVDKIKSDYIKNNLNPYVKDYKLTSPIKEFYDLTKNKDKFRSLSYSDMNLNDRFELGLPITLEEFVKIVDENSTMHKRDLKVKFGKNSFKII